MVTIGAMHLMHVKCISVIDTKLHNFLFYTFCVGIFTNMESLPHYSEIRSFLKYVPTERILKISYFRPEQDVNGKVFNIFEGYKISFAILKVGDVFDSNSCHLRSINPSHDLRDLWGSWRSHHEDFRGIPEPLDQRS
jgi:hypothetical protein